MDNNIKVLFGFLAGATAGAITGILMAPDKGTTTRKSIVDKTSQFKDDINSTVQKSIEKLNSLKESAFSLVNVYGEEAEQKVKSTTEG